LNIEDVGMENCFLIIILIIIEKKISKMAALNDFSGKSISGSTKMS
jgi:hypothetical protein